MQVNQTFFEAIKIGRRLVEVKRGMSLYICWLIFFVQHILQIYEQIFLKCLQGIDFV